MQSMRSFCNGAPEKLHVPVCPGHIGPEHVSALAAELLAVLHLSLFGSHKLRGHMLKSPERPDANAVPL